jgi:hypothetical protein
MVSGVIATLVTAPVFKTGETPSKRRLVGSIPIRYRFFGLGRRPSSLRCGSLLTSSSGTSDTEGRNSVESYFSRSASTKSLNPSAVPTTHFFVPSNRITSIVARSFGSISNISFVN